jgi:hypothetical protein
VTHIEGVGALTVDLHGGLIEFPEEHRSEIHRPDPVVDLLDSDLLVL